MSLELLEQLEAKVKRAVDNMALLKMELDELKEKNAQLELEKQTIVEQHSAFEGRLAALLANMDEE